MSNLIGVIMCGGQSKRRGTDKGLVQIEHQVWATFMADKLSILKIPVIFSINPKQVNKYSEHISPSQLIVDVNQIEGPARGLLTAHDNFPEDDLLLIACDMLALDAHTIIKLIQTYNAEKAYDFYVYQDENYAQPFCGIYKSAGVKKLQDYIFEKGLASISMQNVLNQVNTKRITIENKTSFANYNYKT